MADQVGEVSQAKVCRDHNMARMKTSGLVKLREEQLNRTHILVGPYNKLDHIHIEMIEDKIKERRQQLKLCGTARINKYFFLIMVVGHGDQDRLPRLDVGPCPSCGIAVLKHVYSFYLPRFKVTEQFTCTSTTNPMPRAQGPYTVYANILPEGLSTHIKEEEAPCLSTTQSKYFNRQLHQDGIYFISRDATVQHRETIGRATSLYDNTWSFSLFHYIRRMPHKQLKALYYDVLKYAFGTGASEHIQAYLTSDYSPFPDDIHMVVLGNKDTNKLLDEDRGCIILIICLNGTIKVMNEELTAGDGIIFDSTQTHSLTCCVPHSLHLTIHLQPAPLKGWHRERNGVAVVPNASRLGKVEEIIHDSRPRRASAGAGVGGGSHRGSTKRSAPMSAPPAPPLLRRHDSPQDQDDGGDVDELMTIQHGQYTWTTASKHVEIKAPPLTTGHDPQRYVFTPEYTTPEGRKYHRIERRDLPTSPYEMTPYVAVTHPTQPIGYGVFATRDIDMNDPLAAIDYVGVRASNTYSGRDRDYAVEVVGGRTRLEVANGVGVSEAKELPKFICPDTTGLAAHHGAAHYLNHYHGLAASPNYAMTSDGVLVPLRPIKRGEELVWNYGDTEQQADDRLSFLRNNGVAKAVVKRAPIQPEVYSV